MPIFLFLIAGAGVAALAFAHKSSTGSRSTPGSAATPFAPSSALPPQGQRAVTNALQRETNADALGAFAVLLASAGFSDAAAQLMARAGVLENGPAKTAGIFSTGAVCTNPSDPNWQRYQTWQPATSGAFEDWMRPQLIADWEAASNGCYQVFKISPSVFQQLIATWNQGHNGPARTIPSYTPSSWADPKGQDPVQFWMGMYKVNSITVNDGPKVVGSPTLFGNVPPPAPAPAPRPVGVFGPSGGQPYVDPCTAQQRLQQIGQPAAAQRLTARCQQYQAFLARPLAAWFLLYQ